jgi:DUF4097 and DUF4098 domain-containing protein YvlB
VEPASCERETMMMMMPNRVLSLALAALAAAAAPAAAQPLPRRVHTLAGERADAVRPVLYGQGREEQTDRQTKTLKLGAEGELALANVAGDIVVTRSGGNEATVEIVKTARGGTAAEAREMLGLVEVTVVEREGRAEVKAVYPRGEDRRRENRRNVDVSVAYTVTAPAGTRLTVGSVSGSIRVADIKGDLSVNTVSGGVRIANAGRISTAKSVSGSVEIVDTQVDGGIEAQSVSGNVLFRKVNAQRVEAGSVSGNVVFQDVQCERAEAHSVSGNVEFGGTLAKNGRYELTSHSGDVRIAVGGGTGFELEAESFSGSVRSDLSLSARVRDGGDDDRGRRRALRGVYGDGSAVLNVTTFSGNIVVSKR